MHNHYLSPFIVVALYISRLFLTDLIMLRLNTFCDLFIGLGFCFFVAKYRFLLSSYLFLLSSYLFLLQGFLEVYTICICSAQVYIMFVANKNIRCLF